jgi:hypothetical protein
MTTCKLLDIIHGVDLGQGDDKLAWKLGKKGFTIKFLYNALQTKTHVKVFKKLLNFSCCFAVGVRLTKVKLKKRGREDLCGVCFVLLKSIDRLLFSCPIAIFV